jgi:hypothetical protein
MQRLAGHWTGTYEYEQPDVPGSRQIGFTLDFFDTSSWRLYGEVWDDPLTGGVEAKGTILGWAWGRHLRFRKVMPLHVANDPRPITVDEYVETTLGDRVAGDPGVHVISYRGVIAHDANQVRGTWHFSHRLLVLQSKRVIVFPSASGTWQMRRVSRDR